MPQKVDLCILLRPETLKFKGGKNGRGYDCVFLLPDSGFGSGEASFSCVWCYALSFPSHTQLRENTSK